MLVNRADQKEILTVAAVLVGSRLALELIRSAATQLLSMRWQLVAHRKNKEIGSKAMRMDYDILERNRTLNLIGVGCSCVGAIVTMAGLFMGTPVQGTGAVLYLKV